MDPQLVAKEVLEGVAAIGDFIHLPPAEKVQVVKHILDAEIGSDEGARLKSLPGMTPEITEMVTDPLLDMLAQVIVDKFFPTPTP